jgi:3-phenylpropionate/trans-cinnamate dioxygenase ferredoxin reductase subunit
MDKIVIAGAGQAAIQSAVSLRKFGYEGSITIIGEESHPPYQRPPLSKDYLLGKTQLDRVHLKKEAFYAENKIELIINTKVESIDRKEKMVSLSNKENLAYGKLIIAVGSRVRKLDVPGVNKNGIHYLRGLDDANSLKENLKEGKKLVIVGAGYIGLEVAAVAASLKIETSVIDIADRVMSRTVDPLISDYYHSLHENNGVNIHLEHGLKSITGKRNVEKVFCTNNLELDADIVVIGAGVIPNDELASTAGLTCENGIVVNEFGQTEDENIYACGDCTNHPNKILGRKLRLESVHNAMEQSKAVASSITGLEEPYNQVPWFWSDQYDHKLQIVGLSGDHDEVIMRGSQSEQSFLLFYLKNKEIIAVNAINSSKEFLISKKLVENKVIISSDIISDQSVQLNDLLL